MKGIGTCKLQLRCGQTLFLYDVLYVLEIRRNLVSVRSLLKFGFDVNFHDGSIDFIFQTKLFCSGFLLDGFFVLDTFSNNDYISNNQCFALSGVSDNNLDVNVWHSRLGHVGPERMIRLAKEGLLGSLIKIEMSICQHCLAGKVTRKPFDKGTRANFPLQLIHSDICGPMSVRARHGALYFITFIDDFTRYGHVYLNSHKSEALVCFKQFMSMVENQLDRSIKALRTDCGREYLSDQFKGLCDEKGIVRQLTIPSTPQ